MKEEHSKYSGGHSKINDNAMMNELWNIVHLIAIAMDPTSSTLDWKQPILHACLRASTNDFPYALFERAMKRFRDQFALPDQSGNLPLHAYCSSPDDDDEDYCSGIAAKYPTAAKVKNDDGKLPLDLAIEKGQRGWDTGIADLLEIYPAPISRFRIELAPLLLGQASAHGRRTLMFQMLRSKPDLFTWRR
jgi:hypothetical protein